jgi:DNA-binding LacI/PurR family transcriptional regulator
MAQLTYYALQSINLKIPEDCELISFDQPYIPNVSYVSQNEKEIARKAVDLLYSQIEGIADNKQVKVETSFVNYKKIDNCSRQYHLLYVLNSGTFST